MGFGDRLAAGSGALLLVCLLFLPWFAVSADGEITIGSEASAFRWLDAIAAVLLACALASVALPLMRSARMIGLGAQNVGLMVASAGLTAVSLVMYRIAVPPEADRDLLLLAGLDPTVHVTPRVGAVFGLLAGIGVLAGGAMSFFGLGDEFTAGQELDRPIGPDPPPRTKRRPTSKRARPPATKRLRLPDATAEDLRRLGLSITQARRVIRYRDELGLISGPADIDTVPGIPPALRSAVKAKLRS